MFFRSLTFLTFFASVFTAAHAQRLDATFDLARFKASETQNMVELYCSVNGNSVVYKNVQGGFQATVSLEVQFADSSGIKNFGKMLLKSPVVTDTSKFLPAFNLQKRFALNNGNYTFSGTAKDVNSTAAASVFESKLKMDFQNDKVQLSDVQMLESYAKDAQASDYTKSGFRLVSYVSNFYPKGVDQLKYYSEIYNAEAALGKDKPLVVFCRVFPARDNMSKITLASQKIMKAAPVNVVLQEFAIGTLPSGNYEFIIEVRSEENVVLAKQSRFFQRSNPQNGETDAVAGPGGSDLPAAFAGLTDSLKLNLYLMSLKPVATTAENSFLESVVLQATMAQKQNYLYNFWKKRAEAQPEIAWEEYRRRIEEAEKTFANQTFKAYETDRGRVFLQYGRPNRISSERNDINRPANNTDTKPYQIWHYYELNNQRNRVFVFLQRNVGNPNYNLVHSTAIGEVQDNEWRRISGQRFSGDERTDRNSRRSRSFDQDGNEMHE